MVCKHIREYVEELNQIEENHRTELYHFEKKHKVVAKSISHHPRRGIMFGRKGLIYESHYSDLKLFCPICDEEYTVGPCTVKVLYSKMKDEELKQEIKIKRCLKDEQINIVAMTEGVPIENDVVHQCILCKSRYIKGAFYLLVPKATPKTDRDFKYTKEGERLQREINAKYGNGLGRFECKYAGKVIENYNGKGITPDMWAQLKEEKLFPLWDPSSPPKYIDKYNGDLVLFRVYEIEKALNEYIRGVGEGGVGQGVGRTACLKEETQVKIVKPVMSDEEFKKIKNELGKILQKQEKQKEG